jgi:hypothetical protein
VSDGAVVASACEQAVVNGMPSEGCRRALAMSTQSYAVLTSNGIFVTLQCVKLFERADIKQPDHSFSAGGSDEVPIGTPSRRIDYSSM